ncbi:MAG: DMT family transporter [Gaiellaceae bacterium]|jgi:drug/metabolite transporter (DMT)-like permease
MFAILGGLAAAAFWTVTTLCSSRASRLIGPFSVLAWVMIVGLVVTAPAAAIEGVPANLHGSVLTWLVVSGICNVSGLLFAYEALRLGKVGLASPIVSTEGAVAALIAVLGGEALGLPRGVTLIVIVAGIVAVAAGSAGEEAPGHHDVRAALCASFAALSFGVGMYATGHVSSDVPLVWAVLPPRVVGVAAVAIPLLLSRRIRLTRRAATLVAVSGLAEVGGYFAFAFGARHGIAVTAVLGSQFAVLSAIVAYFLFGEKLGRLRVAGVVVTALGVAVLSALQA